MEQHLDSRCVLFPAPLVPLVPGVPTKTRLEFRFCNKEVQTLFYLSLQFFLQARGPFQIGFKLLSFAGPWSVSKPHNYVLFEWDTYLSSMIAVCRFVPSLFQTVICAEQWYETASALTAGANNACMCACMSPRVYVYVCVLWCVMLYIYLTGWRDKMIGAA